MSITTSFCREIRQISCTYLAGPVTFHLEFRDPLLEEEEDKTYPELHIKLYNILLYSYKYKMIKMCIKAEELSCRYHTISAHLLDIAHLFGCLLILPLHFVDFDDVVAPNLVTHIARIHIFVIKTAF